jgi:hypothetical protein
MMARMTLPNKLILWLSAVLVLVIAVLFALGVHSRARSEDEVRRAAETVQTAETEMQKQSAWEDSIGGTTPEATLALFVTALEAKDYETAVTYFVPTARSSERAELIAMIPEARDEMIAQLKEAKQGSYSLTKDAYTIREPVFVDFVRYENGTWKIKEL